MAGLKWHQTDIPESTQKTNEIEDNCVQIFISLINLLIRMLHIKYRKCEAAKMFKEYEV